MKPAPRHHGFLILALSLVACSGSEDKGPTMTPVTTCSGTFTACGGDVVGSWTLGSVCTNGELTDLFNQQVAADYPSCAQSFTDMSMSSNGTVTYDGSKYTRTGSIQTTGKMKITATCIAEQSGGLVLSAASCSNLGKFLPARYPGSTFTCSYDGTTCNCDMSATQAINDSGTYTLAGSSIVESDNYTYDFCVNGSQLTENMVLYGGVTGVAQLSKK